MKRLLYLSSLCLGLSVFSLFGCQAKKSIKSSEKDAKGEEKTEEVVKSDERIIHQPGTLNKEKLDSIKAVRMKEKRGYRKK